MTKNTDYEDLLSGLNKAWSGWFCKRKNKHKNIKDCFTLHGWKRDQTFFFAIGCSIISSDRSSLKIEFRFLPRRQESLMASHANYHYHNILLIEVLTSAGKRFPWESHLKVINNSSDLFWAVCDRWIYFKTSSLIFFAVRKRNRKRSRVSRGKYSQTFHSWLRLGSRLLWGAKIAHNERKSNLFARC